MKQLFAFLFLMMVSGVFAQAPQGIPYQAVVRNTDGSVMASTAITITFKIHDNTATGTVVYEENHTATTNTQGIISLNVGNGSVVSGTFSGINWGSGNKFLHVLMNSGNGIVDLGTQQMMSVPYALYAAQSGTPGPIGPQGPMGLTGPAGAVGPQGPAGNNGGFAHWVGESFDGGVVFHVYKDAFGVEHGLIVSLNNIELPPTWGLYNTDVPNCESSWNGADNTAAIIGASAELGCAAQLCDAYEAGGLSDWYLPAIDELNLMYNVKFNLHQSLAQIPGGQPIALNEYWSSSEYFSNQAWCFNFATGAASHIGKYSNILVRAIRAF